MTEPSYVVAGQDWPAGPEVLELTEKQANAVLASYARYREKAVHSLALVDVSKSDEPAGQQPG